MNQNNLVEKPECGSSKLDLHQLYGDNIALVIQHVYNELYSQSLTPTVVLSGSSAEQYLKDKSLSTYNPAETKVTSSLRPEMGHVLAEWSSLKTLCRQYGLEMQQQAVTPQLPRYWERKLQLDKQHIFLTLQNALHGSMGTKLESVAPTMYEALSDYLRHAEM